MAKGKFQIDMSKGSIFKNIVFFAFPLMLTSLLQLFYNAADLVIVSRFAGSNAMASVGATSSVTNLLINLFIGLSMGAGVIVSRKFGAQDKEGIKRSVHTAMLLGITVGILAGILGIFISEPILKLMGTPEGEVMDGAVLYMKILFIGVPASLAYNFGASILRAVGDTRRPLYILASAGIINVILNFVLVIFFHLDVAGVAIATAVSNYVSVIAVFYILTHTKDDIKIEIKKLKFHKHELKEILRIGLPAGVQSSFFSLSNTVIQSSVNSFGEAAIAGNAAGGNIEGFVYVAMNAFYQATLTGVSQNYGAQDEKRINKTIWVALLCVIAVGASLGALCVIFSRQLLGIYITDSALALEFGVKRMYLTCLPYFLCGMMEVLTGALRGLGCSATTAITSFIGTCGFRIFWAKFAVEYVAERVHFVDSSIDILYFCWPISWLLVSLMHLVTLIIIKPRAIRRMNGEFI